MSEPADLSAALSPFGRLLGLRLIEAGADLVVAELPVSDRLMQPQGIVHGGVYCAIIETATSIGAAMHVGLPERVVGISNNTRFFRPVTRGTLTCRAEPESCDDEFQLWRGVVSDEAGRSVADGLVNLVHLRDREPSGVC